jgi:NADP-dependent 3-hydroxy acid dehydrogenase YdfG
MKNTFFKDKVVIITGSSMGIGKELAHQVLKAGGKVVLTARNAAKLENVKKDFNMFTDNILAHPSDATDYSQDVSLIKSTIDRFGKLDILITNAGLSCFGEVENTLPEVARQVIDTNIYGSLFPIMAAIPELKKTKGSIMLISSLAGLHGMPGHAPYSISKMSLKALAQSLRIELQHTGIYVGIAYLGFTVNEKEKKTLNAVGDWEAVPQRPKKLTASREETAVKILDQIKNKKHANAHFLFGKITSFLSRIFPYLLFRLLKKNFVPYK